MVTRMSVTASVVGTMLDHAERSPTALAYAFFPDEPGGQPEELLFGDLVSACARVATAIGSVSARGDRVMIVCPPGRAFVTSFLGCLLAGRVAVPVDATPSDRQLSHLASVAEDCDPAAALAPGGNVESVRERFRPHGLLSRLPVVSCDVGQAVDEAVVARAPSEQLAFLQYTSGSTRSPRGVRVRHDNLVDNLRTIQRSFGHTPQSRAVTWLPPFHDMGLIGGLLQPLFVGFPTAVLSHRAFLRRPFVWLDAVCRFGATTSGGPPTAFEQCTSRISPDEAEGLDLSVWDLAYVGAEPISPRVLDRFVGRFAENGFRAATFYPCYGLAEATLLVSGGPKGRGGHTVAFRDVLNEGKVRPESTGERALVAVGPVQTGTVRVVDQSSGRDAPPGATGEIWLRGPSVTEGYWRETSDSPFLGAGANENGDGGSYLRTGDVGFVLDGDLFIAGRLKEVVIVGGRNIFPPDVEASIEGSDPHLPEGGTTVFGVDDDGEERIVVLQEDTRCRGDVVTQTDLAARIRDIVSRKHDLSVWRVVFVRRGHVPKTTSGKKQRGHARARFLAETAKDAGA